MAADAGCGDELARAATCASERAQYRGDEVYVDGCSEEAMALAACGMTTTVAESACQIDSATCCDSPHCAEGVDTQWGAPLSGCKGMCTARLGHCFDLHATTDEEDACMDACWDDFQDNPRRHSDKLAGSRAPTHS